MASSAPSRREHPRGDQTPILTLERQNDPAWTRPDRWLWRSNALRVLPQLPTPKLLIDHDDDQVIGYVEKILGLEDIDGPWFMGKCVVTDPPHWLKRGTPSSLSSKILAPKHVQRRHHLRRVRP